MLEERECVCEWVCVHLNYIRMCVYVCVLLATCSSFLSCIFVYTCAHTLLCMFIIFSCITYHDFLCIFPLTTFFWPHVSFCDIIIYIRTHIREELCEAALKSDSAAVHDGTRRRILIVAHRCVCVDRWIHLCQFINTRVFLGGAQSQLPITYVHICVLCSYCVPICLTKPCLGFVLMCATTERASENFPKWAMERRSVTRPTAVWRPSGMLLSPWLPLSGHACLILNS